MNILIVGNLSSGKTSIANKLKEKRNTFEYVSIDDLRREKSDGTYAGEFFAWSYLLNAVQHPSDDGTIIEFSGTGKNSWFVRESIRYSMEKYNAKWIVVYCLCEESILIERNKNRKNDVPFPYKFENIISGIKFISSELSKRYSSNYWLSPEMTIRTDQNTVEECADLILKKLG